MKTNNSQLAAIMKLQKQLSQKRVNRQKIVKELVMKEKKQRVIDNLVNVIEYLRGYHMDDMVPAAMRRAYVAKLAKLDPNNPKLNNYYTRQSSKSKVSQNIVRNLKNTGTKQSLSMRVMAKYRNLMNRLKKRQANRMSNRNRIRNAANAEHKNRMKKRQNKRNDNNQNNANQKYNNNLAKLLQNMGIA